MKKLVLVLVLALIAAPSFGALSLTLTETGNIVTLGYTGADSANLPRAFGLTVAISGGANIVDINNYKQGESTSGAQGFGIYPATIDINSVTGFVNNYGTPLAVQGAPGAGDQVLPSNAFVVEFGSLYVGDGNAPATSGTLCKFKVDCGSATGNVTISIGEEDTYRGGVVLEDGTTPATALTASLVHACSIPAPSKATNPYPADLATGVSRAGVSLTWSAGSGATSRDVYFGTVNPPVTKVIADGTVLTYATGAMSPATTYYWRVDEKNAGGTTTGDVWRFTTDECFYVGRVFDKTICTPNLAANITVTTTMYNNWVTAGKPSCWCCNAQKCGNAANNIAGQRVDGADIAALKASWLKTPGQSGYNACADINMSGRVDGADVAIVKAHWLANVGYCTASY